jgi:flagellar hook-associated protein 2
VSETDYQLIITGTDTNKAMTATTISGDVLQNLGLVDVGDTFEAAQIIQNEQGSRILLDGATITRDDNSYDDLINGVTIDIKTADAGTTITLAVDNDIATSKDAILGLIDSYNAYREFVSLNQEVGADGTVPDTAILFSDSILDTLHYAVSSMLSSATGDGEAGSLRNLGINFDLNNRLVLDDEAALDNALLNDFQNVANFFSTDVDIDNAEVAVISNTSAQEALSFSIDIVTDVDGNMISAQVGGASPFTIDGTRLIGNAGTAYEGLTFAYAGTTDTTVAISLNAGLADLLYNAIEGYTNPNGIIQDEISQYQDENIDFEVEAGEIRARGEEIREDEIQKYAVMEANLSTLDSLLNTIRALLGTNDD